MVKDIGVYVGENGKTTTLYDKGKIIVYRKKQGAWIILKEKEFVMNKTLNMKELRQKMAEVLDFLNECNIFVGLSISGVPYFELEKSQFSVWEFEGKPMEFLDYILEEERKSARKTNRVKNNLIPAPVETSAGCYRISLKEIQESNTGFTSKQVLLPFLHKGIFYSLEIICSHVPPWLQAELSSNNFSGEIEKINNKETRIMITKNCCRQNSS